MLALIPLAVMAVFFFVFEPSDYWSVKGWSDYDQRAVAGLREILNKDVSRVIAGDSRTANLNLGAIEEASGKEYCDLAFGGSTFPDSIKLIRYALEHDDIEEIVIGLSFYNMNDYHWADKIDAVIPKAENVFEYLSDAQYWIAAQRNLNAKLLNPIADLTGLDILRVNIEDPSALRQVYVPSEELIHGWRRDLWEYGNIIADQITLEGYSNEQTLAELRSIVEICREKDIELKFILFPSNRVIWENVIYPMELEPAIENYKAELRTMGTVYDMEWYSSLARDDSLFQDGFHMTLDGKLLVIDAVFGGGEYEWCTVTEP